MRQLLPLIFLTFLTVSEVKLQTIVNGCALAMTKPNNNTLSFNDDSLSVKFTPYVIT